MRHAYRAGMYAIVNTKTGAQYVGSTVRFDMRRWKHFRLLRQGKHHSAHLQAAWNKYGESAFEFRVLAVVEKFALRDTEQRLLDLLYGQEGCYNVSRDATAPMRGRKASPEHIAKAAAANRGQKRSPEFCAKMSAINKGKRPSDKCLQRAAVSSRTRVRGRDYRASVSARSKVYWLTVSSDQRREHGQKTRELHQGRKRSKETRERISASKKGKKIGVPMSAEARANMSAAQKGRPKTPEHRAALSKALTGRAMSGDAYDKLLAAAQKRVGVKMDPEAVARSAAARTGAKRSPEARAKMSAAAKARVVRERVTIKKESV